MIASFLLVSLLKYSVGNCVVFNPEKFKQPVEGVVMTILGTENGTHYKVLLPHPRFKKPTIFKAWAEKFDEVTLLVECRKENK